MKTNCRWARLTLSTACLGAFSCQGNIGGHLNGGGGPSGSGGSISMTTGTGGGSSPTGGGSSSGSGGTTGTDPTDCTPLTPLPRRVWRLSAAQWGNAVKDLLSLSAPPTLTSNGGEAPTAFIVDPGLRVDPSMLFDMYDQSQTVLSQIDSKVTTTLAPCSGTTASAQTTCATNFIQTLATKAYRRPLDSSEVPNLMKVYAQGAMTDYKTGIEAMIQAVILSTSFVYRTELGPSTLTADSSGKYPDTTLTPYEVASQISFTLLGSLPDSALTAAAADGSLGTASGIMTQINRLLALPAVQSNLTNLVLSWFNVNQMFSKVKDTSLFSALSSSEQDQTAIKNDLLTSTQDWVNGVLWGGSGKINDLLTSQTVYVNQRLATLYPGLSYANGKAPTSDSTFVAATWPTSQGRSGVLTQPAYLWAASDPSLTSIVKRGRGIHDSIVCADPLPGPVDLSTPSAMNVIACKSPDGTQTLSACDSEVLQSNARLSFQPCMACHQQMDPYSRVLLNFGPIGNYRTVDEAGDTIDPTVTFSAGSPFAGQSMTGAPAFAQAMVSTGTFNGCSVQQMASYAIGSPISVYDTCELNTLRTQTDGTVKGLFANLMVADFVRARTGGTK
jgi:Protein of unknown function (DUF1592)/Protein of unknown function (DUF1595)/Protein of unknown function (DUF1588)